MRGERGAREGVSVSGGRGVRGAGRPGGRGDREERLEGRN